MHSSRMRTVRCSGHLSCHAHPPAMHSPAMYAPCHACPLSCMPPCHTRLPCHAHPLPYFPCHTCPLPHMPPTMQSPATHASLPRVNKITDACENSVAECKKLTYDHKSWNRERAEKSLFAGLYFRILNFTTEFG